MIPDDSKLEDPLNVICIIKNLTQINPCGGDGQLVVHVGFDKNGLNFDLKLRFDFSHF